jgi:hypothetical protein
MIVLDMKNMIFEEVRLGDYLLVNNEPRTVRGIIGAGHLPFKIKGYIILGELDYIVEIPTEGKHCTILSPSTQTPNNGESVMEGAITYFAPHLPAVGGAMGELLFRVVVSKGYSEPIILIYRNAEVIAYYKYDVLSTMSIRHERIKKSKAGNETTPRHAAIVNPPNLTDKESVGRVNSNGVDRILRKTKKFFS